MEAIGRASYRTLWDVINGARGFGWAENPWVLAYTFEVVPAEQWVDLKIA